MERHLKHLSKDEQRFIDLVCINGKKYEEAAMELGVDISVIRKYYESLDSEWRPIAKVRDKWKIKENKSFSENPTDYIKGNFWDFYDWVKTTDEICHYCKITQKQLDQLHEIGIINSRPTRGKTFEIDRKESKRGYNDISNLTYACYWCNNAKTDTFTEEEFLIIGEAISRVWKKRLANDKR